MAPVALAPYSEPYSYAAWSGIAGRGSLGQVYLGFWGVLLTRSVYFPLVLSVLYQAVVYMLSSERTNAGVVDPIWYLPLGGKTFSEAMVGDQIFVMIGLFLGWAFTCWSRPSTKISYKVKDFLDVFVGGNMWGKIQVLVYFTVICLVTAAAGDNLDTDDPKAGYYLQLIHVVVPLVVMVIQKYLFNNRGALDSNGTTVIDLLSGDPKDKMNQASGWEGETMLIKSLANIRTMFVGLRLQAAIVTASVWLCYIPDNGGWHDNLDRFESLLLLVLILSVFFVLTAGSYEDFIDSRLSGYFKGTMRRRRTGIGAQVNVSKRRIVDQL